MKTISLSCGVSRAALALGCLFIGLLTAQAQQQGGRGGGRQIDPAQIQERLQQMGIDPAQLQERLQQMGIDPAQLLNRARQNGGDPSQFGGQGAAGGVAMGGQQLFDPAQLRERIVDTYQEQLEFPDDEWAVVRPLVKEVIEKRNAFASESLPMVGTLGGGRAAGGAGEEIRLPRAVGAATPEESALRAAIDASAATQDLKAKLEEFRVAKKKQADELKAAREKLRKVLSVRREAKAVLFGLLE